MIIWGRTQDWYTWPKAEIGWRPRGQMGSNLPMDDDSLILFVSLVIFYLYYYLFLSIFSILRFIIIFTKTSDRLQSTQRRDMLTYLSKSMSWSRY